MRKTIIKLYTNIQLNEVGYITVENKVNLRNIFCLFLQRLNVTSPYTKASINARNDTLIPDRNN